MYLVTRYILLMCRGGIELVFNGSNLDVVQNPMLEVNDQDYLDSLNVSLNFQFVCGDP